MDGEDSLDAAADSSLTQGTGAEEADAGFHDAGSDCEDVALGDAAEDDADAHAAAALVALSQALVADGAEATGLVVGSRQQGRLQQAPLAEADLDNLGASAALLVRLLLLVRHGGQVAAHGEVQNLEAVVHPEALGVSMDTREAGSRDEPHCHYYLARGDAMDAAAVGAMLAAARADAPLDKDRSATAPPADQASHQEALGARQELLH